MRDRKYKILTCVIALVLMLSMISPLLREVRAQSSAINSASYPFLSVSPNPVGVNQPLTIVMWLSNVPPQNQEGISVPYEGFKVTIMHDGQNTTLGPFTSDDVGSYSTSYTPTATGNYSFVFNFPGQYINESSAITAPSKTSFTVYFEPSQSSIVTITVQSQAIQSYPNTPLPTAYWQAPVEGNTAMWEWTSISGNWLGIPLEYGNGCSYETGYYNPYTDPTLTDHIIWNDPITMMGQVGGNFSSTDYYTGLSYEAKFQDVIVIDGRLYYDVPLSNAATGGGAACIDLATGKQIWWQNITINFGQLFDYESPNQQGVIPYLWSTGSTYNVYDPDTGDLITSFNHALSGRILTQPDGELDVYVLGNGWLAMWNSTLCFVNNGMQVYSEVGGINGEWRPMAGTYNWLNGLQWNTTNPTVPGTLLTFTSAFGPSVLIAAATTETTQIPFVTVVAYSATTGAQLWSYNITNWFTERPYYNFSPIYNGTYCWFDQNTMQWFGYNALTGKQIWGPTAAPSNAWNFYEQGYAGCGPTSPTVANGIMYISTYAGVYTIDMGTGKLLWNWQSPSTGFSNPYGQQTFYGGVLVAGGMVYAASEEHSHNEGTPTHDLWCLNATSGTAVWSIEGSDPDPIIVDGRLVAYDVWDGNVYSFGQGNTATTVTAPTVSVSQGSSVLIQGTVTDQSPGQTCLGIPEAGTPAVSDASMSSWMEYLFMQQPEPNNVTGVPVTLEAIDPNGNLVFLGNTTSDGSGTYSLTVNSALLKAGPGTYKILAYFYGTNSYYASSAETSLYVSAAAGASPTPAPVSGLASTTTLEYSTAAIVIVIIVIGAVLALLVTRKHP